MLDSKSCREIVSLQNIGYEKCIVYWTTISVSYITAWIYFKVSYKDTYEKRAPLAINRAPLLLTYFYTTAAGPKNSRGYPTRE